MFTLFCSRPSTPNMFLFLCSCWMKRSPPSSFLINNYHYVHEQFSMRNLQADDRDKFLSLLEEQKQLFVEEELSESFGRLLDFVPKAEAQLGIQAESMEDGVDVDGRGAVDSAKQKTKEEMAVAAASVDKSQIGSLVRHFGSTWKAGISHMAKSINTYFQDLKNGMSILKLCLTQLLLYHTRFQEIIDRVFKNMAVPFAKERVPIQSLFFEIRKYSQ